MKQTGKICLVTSAHISSNPRLVKEADALASAGFEVRVVAMNRDAATEQHDNGLMQQRAWRLQTVNAQRSGKGRCVWLRAVLRQKIIMMGGLWRCSDAMMARAYSRFMPELTRLAASEPADLFIAHNLPALPAVVLAALKWKAKLGFDAEDFHRGEFRAVSPEAKLTMLVEEKYLPLCDHLTAASEGIAQAYADVLGGRKLLTILNVFPLAERSGNTPADELRRERSSCDLSLYWYSQVIGPDRGLEDALEALAQLKEFSVVLSVRGKWAVGYEEQFFSRAEQLGVVERVRILPPVSPEQLVERAMQHDVGLALEPGDRQNNQLAASNKLFVYFLAGLAVAATETGGQRNILESVPQAGFTYNAGKPGELARKLRSWLENPQLIKEAQAAARQAAESEFCWEVESKKLTQSVLKLLDEKVWHSEAAC